MPVITFPDQSMLRRILGGAALTILISAFLPNGSFADQPNTSFPVNVNPLQVAPEKMDFFDSLYSGARNQLIDEDAKFYEAEKSLEAAKSTTSIPRRREHLRKTFDSLDLIINKGVADADTYTLYGKTAIEATGVSMNEEERLFWRTKAIDALEESVRLDPKNEEGWAELAEIYFAESEELCDSDPEESIRLFEECDAVFERALEAMPESNLLWYLWAADYSIHAYNVPNPDRRIFREKAISKYKLAIELEEDDDYSWRMMAKTWWRISDDLDEDDPELPSILRNAHDDFIEAYAITPRGSAWPIALIAAQLNMDEDHVRRHLEMAARIGELEYDDLLTNKAFADYRDYEWFQALIR